MPAKLIRFGKLLDGLGNVFHDANILVENGSIKAVDPTRNFRDAETIDLAQFTGMPALIDVHTHMTFGPTRGGGGRTPVVNMVLGQDAAKRTLEAGVTTVRDLNSTGFLDVAMRDLINMGAMIGPRMFVVGHGLKITGAKQGAGRAPTGGFADGPADVMRVVRQQIAAGVDWIKIFGSTGGMDDTSGYQTFTFEEIKAAVDVAHNLGKRVAIHAYGAKAASDAVRAGADSIEHAVDMDDDTVAEMARRKVFYVPTIDHNRYFSENWKSLGFSAKSIEQFDIVLQRNLETTKRAFRAGVPIAMGSDANFTMFGENTRELGWFIKAGMSIPDALATATTNAAILLGMEKSLGKIASGYLADIIAVEGDPTLDMAVVMNNVKWVMKDGNVVVDKSKSN